MGIGYDLDAEAITSVLKVIDAAFPPLAHLQILSYYIDDWNNATYHLCSDVPARPGPKATALVWLWTALAFVASKPGREPSKP